jgi:FkbM family methyltransferase
MEKISHRAGSFAVDSSGDPYGSGFWRAIESRKYEPDTIGFLEDNLSKNTVFMDIGAANGAMTIIASLLKSEVVSYEPDPTMYKVLENNLNLNPDLKKNVKLFNSGISNILSSIEFNAKADSSIFSSIVVGNNTSKGKVVAINPLSSEIVKVHQDSKKKLVIKMDIEGAEWRILNDIETLITLKNHGATLLLAVHPGFYRPHKKIFKGIDKISISIWHFRNYRESVKTYKKIIKYGNVFRTNLNPIRNARIFATLILGGYHEFILEF